MHGLLRGPMLIFLPIAFGLSWLTALVMYTAGIEYGSNTSLVLIAFLYMGAPAIAALVVRWKIEPMSWIQLGVRWQGINWKWMALTVLIGCAFLPGTLLFTWLFGDVFEIEAFGEASLSMSMVIERIYVIIEAAGMGGEETEMQLAKLHELGSGAVILMLVLVSAIIAAFTVNLPFMLGEELGWRGYMQRQLRTMGMWKVVLLTGFIWGLWHAPLILMGHNYPDHPWVGVLMMCVFTTLLAYPFAHLRVRTNCIWGPCVLHGIINATAGGYMVFATDSSSFLGSPVGVSGFCAIAVICILLYIFDPRVDQHFESTGQ